jgi:hypothetical protein
MEDATFVRDRLREAWKNLAERMAGPIVLAFGRA